MAVQVSYPGVYIDEFAPGAPIQGVGTGTAAFVGVAIKGDLDTPNKITSWDAFQQAFGAEPRAGFFLWYVVRGFFENGGQVCYVVRASNAIQGSVAIRNAAQNAMATVVARQPGNPAMTIEVVANPYFPGSSAELVLYQPTAELANAPGGKELTFESADDAGQFRPGDSIFCDTTGDRVSVVRVTGAVVQIGEDLVGSPQTGDEFRLADLAAGERTVRLAYVPGGTNTPIPKDWLQQGSILSFDYDASETHVVESVQTQYLSNTDTTYGVTLRTGLLSPLSLIAGSNVSSTEFDFKVTLNTTTTSYQRLSFDSAHPNYYEKVIADDPSGLVTIEPLSPPPLDQLPDALPDEAAYNLPAENAEDLSSLASSDFIEALRSLEGIDDVNLVAVPDCIALKDATEIAAVHQEMIGHCERLADRFAVIDSAPGLTLFSTGDGKSSIEDARRGLDSSRGYAALYYPWLRVAPAGSGGSLLVPPSGHVCGIYSRSDQKRGVHKAPANEIVAGALGIERTMSNIEQGQLNLQGVNVIRVFAGGRPTLWGARTTATDRNWQYVNIRRLFLYLEESIQEGIRWAVFEPNNLQLWQKLKRTITEFLKRAWRDGALFGATPEEAFYVRIDETLNPFSERALGRLTIEVGVSPSYPAEFIVLRIGIWEGGAAVTES